MTYWATLWYAGTVVLTIGYEGQTKDLCKQIGEMIMYDITTAYADPDILADIVDIGVFPTDEFSFSCETEQLPTDERYME